MDLQLSRRTMYGSGTPTATALVVASAAASSASVQLAGSQAIGGCFTSGCNACMEAFFI